MSPDAKGQPIPLSVPHLAGNEWAYIRECLETNWVSYVGPFVTKFEEQLAGHAGCRYAVATNSGTAALHIALLNAGAQADSEVVMPAISFIAPANAIAYCGAWPALIDVSPVDWQMDLAKLADFLRHDCLEQGGALRNGKTGRRVSAILAVHLLGDMADVDGIAELCARYRLPLIEDAAECMGARYKERGIAAPNPALDPALRQVITSFNGNKIVTTGGGGALLTNDAELARRGHHLTTTAKSDSLRFEHDAIGYNYRLTNVCAALGVAQLEQLEHFVHLKRATAAKYSELLKNVPGVRLHPESLSTRSIFWLYTILLDEPVLPVIEQMNRLGVQARPVWTPIYAQPMFCGKIYSSRCEFAPRLHAHAVSLPSSVGITDEEIEAVVDALGEARDACAS